MKLIIQIPCLNEEKTLPDVLRDLPREIEGVDVIEVQVIDDGSTDDTVKIARELGVDHVISFNKNKGLAAAFRYGAMHALQQGADILVNTDGDNQYMGQDIPRLVRPILEDDAELVMGCRPIDDHPEFSWAKRQLQKLGSWVIRQISGTTVRDAASGFRAYTREALLQLNVLSDFSYCLETLIQAGVSNMKVVSVDIGVNPKTRESRLFSNMAQYLVKSAKTIVSIFILYRSNVFFGILALAVFALSAFFAVRFLALVLFWESPAELFWPTLFFSGVLLIIACQIYLAGVLSSLLSSNRKVNEEILYRLRKRDVDLSGISAGEEKD